MTTDVRFSLHPPPLRKRFLRNKKYSDHSSLKAPDAVTLLNRPNITDKSEKYEDLKLVMGNGSFTALCEGHVNNVSYEIGMES
ncbi:hypothetical protein HZH68_015006 [Vespula germanica]|uniref:Uncharacterized protein n=1 Tax=Vespula germanica TaxID=30212 RepID=A0A834J9N9_VESGE|nr:hypothetical protein HZH68_015006 [Vespula germanica]